MCSKSQVFYYFGESCPPEGSWEIFVLSNVRNVLMTYGSLTDIKGWIGQLVKKLVPDPR